VAHKTFIYLHISMHEVAKHRETHKVKAVNIKAHYNNLQKKFASLIAVSDSP